MLFCAFWKLNHQNREIVYYPLTRPTPKECVIGEKEKNIKSLQKINLGDSIAGSFVLPAILLA